MPTKQHISQLILTITFLITFHKHYAQSSVTPSTITIPTIPLTSLQTGLHDEELTSILTTKGIFSVKSTHLLPKFQSLRQKTFENLCGCMQNPDFLGVEGARSVELSDGATTRVSLATATMGDRPLPLPTEDLNKICGMVPSEMEGLRDFVAYVSQEFIKALDRLLDSNGCHGDNKYLLKNVHGGGYRSVMNVVRSSSHLEHFHVYSKKGSNGSDYVDVALQPHTDAGLFLAFVPSFPCSSSQESGFYVKGLEDGIMDRVEFPEDGTVVIMLGAGAEHWLQSETMKLRATRHAVKMRSGQSRAWYGMMHLVPENAIIQHHPFPQTFADMRQAVSHPPITNTNPMTQSTLSLSHALQSPDISIGCGHVPHYSYYSTPTPPTIETLPSRRYLQHVDSSACNNSTNFYCWMSCLDIPDADNAELHIRAGDSLYCLDPSVLKEEDVAKAEKDCESNGVPGGAMNPACVGFWHPTVPGVPSQFVVPSNSTNETGEEKYCHGATSMYMKGFEWEGSTCVVYLFQPWVLDTKAAFVGACFGTVLFGIVLEGVIFSRRYILKALPSDFCFALKPFVSALVYGIQLTMGYFLMLVVMTYSAPLLISVIVGLMTGHFIFNLRKKKIEVEGLTPCCQNDVGNAETDHTGLTETNKSFTFPGSNRQLEQRVEMPSSETGDKDKVDDNVIGCCTGVLENQSQDDETHPAV